MKRTAYLPKTHEEREILRKILLCHVLHTQIIKDRAQAIRMRAARNGSKPRRVWLDTALHLFSHRALEAWVNLRKLGIASDSSEFQQYPFPVEEFEYSQTPPKYRIRPYNILREKLRLAMFAPEVFETQGLKILDLSSGACAAYDILSNLGHQVTSADYWDLNTSATPFSPHWKHYGIQPQHFDGRILPLPFLTQKYDLVLCHQAINFYAKTDQYHHHIEDICRLSKGKVILTFNASEDKKTGRRDIDLPDLSFLKPWNCRKSRCPETYLPVLVLTKPNS